jgi:hypothetical protein
MKILFGAILAILVFLGAAFINTTFDIKLWSEECRMITVTICCACVAAGGMLEYLTPEKESYR